MKAERLGLLRGVDPETDEFFASNIAMDSDGLSWLGEPGFFWKAVKNDAADRNVSPGDYIENVADNFCKFLRSGIMHGRDDLIRLLAAEMCKRATTVIFLGGRRMGKSLLLQNLRDAFNDGHGEERNAKRVVLYINARLCRKNFVQGLYSELARLQLSFPLPESLVGGSRDQILSYYTNHSLLHTMDEFFTLQIAVGLKERNVVPEERQEILAEMRQSAAERVVEWDQNISTAGGVIQNFVDFASSQGLSPTLVIDEAEYLVGDGVWENGMSEISRLQWENRGLTVVLASSAPQFRYQAKRQGLNIGNMTSFVVAGDISCKEAWDLLVNATYTTGTMENPIVSKRIGMGRHLAELCLAAFGGHLVRIKDAVVTLCLKKETFAASETFTDLTGNVLTCLQSDIMRPVLKDMTQYGSVKADSCSKALDETIAKLELGHVLCRYGYHALHVPASAWEHRNFFALIPTWHGFRLAIAWQLAADWQTSEMTDSPGDGASEGR